MKVEILKNTGPLFKLAYFAGDTPDIKESLAAKLIKAGYAKEIKTAKLKTKPTPNPKK